MHRRTPSRRVVESPLTRNALTGNALTGNALALAASRVIAAAGALVLAFIVSRRLGSDAFGRFGAIAAAGFVANTAITFGTDTVIVRAIADGRGDGRELTSTSMVGQLIGAVALIAAAGVAFALDLVGGAVVVQAVGLVPMALVTVAGAVLRGGEHMRPLAEAAVVSAVGSLAIALVLVDTPDHVGRAIGALVIGQCLAAGLLAARALPRVPPGAGGVEESRGLGRRLASLASQTWVFAAMVVASALSLQGVLALVAALGARRGDGGLDLGGLVASMRVLEAARIVPAAAFGAVLPAAFAGRWPASRMRRWSVALLGYAAAVSAVAALVGERILRWAFGPVGHPGVVSIVALALVPIVLRLRRSTELLGAGRERIVLVASVLGALTAIVVAVVAVLGVAVDADAIRLIAIGQVAGVLVSLAVLGLVRSPEARPTADGSPSDGSRADGAENGSIR